MSLSSSEARAVVFDSNPYRVLAFCKNDAAIDVEIERLRQMERRRGVHPFVSYWTAFELLSHLADPADPGYSSCRSAVRVLWRHCRQLTDQHEYVRFAVDSEAQLAMILFGFRPPDRDTQAAVYNGVLQRVANSVSAEDLVDLEPGLKALSAHCAAVEHQFIDDMRTYAVKGLDADATDWQPFKTKPDQRKKALDFIRSGRGLPIIAGTLVVKAANLAGVHLDDSLLEAKQKIVLEHFRAALEMYNDLVLRVVMSGADLTKANRANWIWDVQLCVLASESVTISGFPLVLVTDDKPMLAAIERGGASSRSMSLSSYQSFLASDK